MTPLALTILTLIAQYGPGAFATIWDIAHKTVITPDDIKLLADIKPPSAYLTLSYVAKPV
jgi:hypothetical protein